MLGERFKNAPKDCVIESHALMMRGGYMKYMANGIFSLFTPAKRIMRKIEQIIREEMDAVDGQEVMFPVVMPASLWEESGRWDAYGPEMWRLNDRNGRGFCLGPTAEEVFTDIIRNDLSSYRQLPMMLYQITDKFRDEARPRFGMMRSRNFIMKDNYSFDRDEEGLEESYMQMYDAYSKVFTRCGLTFRPVEADNGAIGGTGSHEFTALCEYGESEICYCDECNLATTIEKAACKDAPEDTSEMLPMEKVHTPGTSTIEMVADFLRMDKKQTLKALMFETYGEDDKVNGYVAVFIRGDRELNMTKLVNALGVHEYAIAFADEEKMAEKCGCVGGFTGPTGLHDCIIVADSEVPGLKNLAAGACEEDYHIKNVNYGRDWKADIVTDVKNLLEGDPCPVCGAPIKHARGVEVGQIFKLGTKYSAAMGAYYKDENQKDNPILMGCYGIGISRTFQAIIDMPENHDENGIIWPMSVAPYHVIITLMKPDDEVQKAVAEDVYEKLQAAGVEVLLDDRKERPGVKFKDADLIGIPIRITVGRGAADGIIEYKMRRDADKVELSVDEGIAKAIETVNAEKDGRCYFK